MFRYLLATAVLIGPALPAWAETLTYSGALSSDEDVAFIDISLSSDSDVTFRSLSYAGGETVDGDTFGLGGFDPILTVFAADGMIEGFNDDGFEPEVGADPNTGGVFDSFLQLSLAAGDYSVAISVFDNFAGTVKTDPFTRAGEPGFTAAFCSAGGAFCDATGAERTGDWAFEALIEPSVTVDPPLIASVPLPTTGALSLLALTGLAGFRRWS